MPRTVKLEFRMTVARRRKRRIADDAGVFTLDRQKGPKPPTDAEDTSLSLLQAPHVDATAA